MTEQVGSIEYIVEADTNGLLKAEKTVNASTGKIAKDFDKVERSAKRVSTQITKTSKGVKTGLSGIGRGAGQAGIQFQQFIGQIQGGQSAMLALSQQSADLGFVLGAPLLGAVVGISASLVGILLPSLLKTNEATKDFKFSVSEAAKELENLDDLSKAQVSIAIDDTNKSMKELSEAAGESGKRIAEINRQLDTGIKKNDGYTNSSIGKIESLKLSSTETKKLIDELKQEQANLDKINQQYKKESDLLVKLTTNKSGFSKETQKQKDSAEELSKGIEAQIVALESGEEAAFRFATAQQLGLEVGELIPANIDAQISALFKLKKAQDDARKSKQDADREARETASLTSKVSGVGLSPEQALTARFAKQNELLRTAKEQEILTESEFLARKLELNKQHEESLLTLRGKTQSQSLINFESLQNQIIGSLASVATGAQDGEEAVRSLAKSVLTELVGALIKQGVQTALNGTLSDELKNKTIDNIANVTAADTASKAKSTATSVAQSSAVATAAAPAAALTSTYSFGTAALIGGAAVLGTLALVKAASGRQYGGPVNNGSMYRVGEDGPEIFSSGGKNFMIPGQNGKVISNNEINNQSSSQNNISLTLNIDPRSPEEFSDQLIRNAPLLTNLVQRSLNDRGRNI